MDSIIRGLERVRVDQPDYLNIDYYEGRKERNLDLYEITDNNMRKDFIARYVGYVNNPDDDENPDVHLRFMIMYKRPSNLRYPNCTYPWINIHSPFFVIKNTATNELRTVPTDDLQFRNDELQINLIDDDRRDNEIASGEYVIRQTDVLDNNLPVEIFDPNTNNVVFKSVPQPSNSRAMNLGEESKDPTQFDTNSMDTSGGKRRKTRRRTKRNRKSKKVKVFYGGATINYPNGNKYDGDVDENQIPNGEGIMRYPGEPYFYFGEMVQPPPGTPGNVYEGHWVNGQKSGQGIMTYFNREEYKGNWANDTMHGKGYFRYINGDAYEGNWQNGIKNGQGIMSYGNGNRYDGNWENGIKSGQGKNRYPNGNRYEGNWENDLPNGEGIMTYSNKSRYIGNWENGQRSGFGIMTTVNGDTYEGNWQQNQLNGQGKMTYHNGDIYEGNFENRLPDGQGKMTYHNGDTYEGNFSQGQLNGYGTMRFSNGKKWVGIWVNGQKIGTGRRGYGGSRTKKVRKNIKRHRK